LIHFQQTFFFSVDVNSQIESEQTEIKFIIIKIIAHGRLASKTKKKEEIFQGAAAFDVYRKRLFAKTVYAYDKINCHKICGYCRNILHSF